MRAHSGKRGRSSEPGPPIQWPRPSLRLHHASTSGWTVMLGREARHASNPPRAAERSRSAGRVVFGEATVAALDVHAPPAVSKGGHMTNASRGDPALHAGRQGGSARVGNCSPLIYSTSACRRKRKTPTICRPGLSMGSRYTSSGDSDFISDFDFFGVTFGAMAGSAGSAGSAVSAVTDRSDVLANTSEMMMPAS